MPLKNQLHVSAILSNVSVKYGNQELIWDKVFPQVPVTKDTDLYFIYERNFRVPQTARAPKAVANETTFYLSTGSYQLAQHALKDYVGVDEAENFDLNSLQVDATENLTDTIYRRIELTVAALMTKTSWSLNHTLAATAAWTLQTTVSDPVASFDTAASVVIANSGYTPNFGIIPRAQFISIKNHMSVLDRVKYTSSEVSKEMIGALIGIPELHVPTGIYDSYPEGTTSTTQAMSAIWTQTFIGWKPSSPGMRTPSCGYTFVRSAPRVRTWFDNERNATAVEVEIKFQPKIVASLTGYLICGT